MNHIPAEVLQQVFNSLEWKDKLECMLVCRFWYDTLDRCALLYDVYIKVFEFHKLKDMLDRFPYRATQVEYLEIGGRFDPDFDKRQVCNMFPNLRQLIMTGRSINKRQAEPTEPFQFSHTTCKLDKIGDVGKCELAPQLAMSNLCNNLKSLDLDFTDSFFTDDNNNFFAQLKNMPVLEELVMTRPDFKLTDLEVMHGNLPSITILKLNFAHLVSGEIPQQVVPTSLITALEMGISEADDSHTYIQLFKYIGHKYPCVKSPVFRGEMRLSLDGTDMIPQIYNEGIFPLYQKIGSQVDNFIFNDYFEGFDAFRKFDEYGMKLKDLTIRMSWQIDDVPFIEELVQSQQHKYIQTLHLDDIIPESISMISNLETLETLSLIGSCFYDDDGGVLRKDINFTQLIDSCPPTLTTLSIDNIYLIYDGLTSNITSIKHLTITDVRIIPMLADIIETSFPQLSTLKLSGEITSNITISFLNHTLKEVNFTAMYDEDEQRNDYSIESKCDDGVQYHAIKRTPNSDGDGPLYALDSRAKPVVKTEYALKFICPSLKQFFFSTEKKWEEYQ